MEMENAELLPRAGTRSQGKSLGEMVLSSKSYVPAPTASFLQSRIDHQEMVQWQEGGSEAIQPPAGSEVEGAQEPTTRKFDHPTICGMDKRPFFPTVLFASLVWSLCMTKLQSRVLGSAHCTYLFVAMYVITIVAALYTALSNPGLLTEELYRKLQAGQMSIPQRSHKHWLYRRPVLRFHQYCRWVTNAIGLRNHRTYMVMLAGFVTIAVSDAIVDLVLLPVNFHIGTLLSELILILHLLYSAYFAWYSVPLLRQHSSFICRNELTQEWKRDLFYIIHDEETGMPIPVNDLDTDAYNRHFDANSFEYDETKNSFDKRWVNNCITFWITSRSDGELGEF